MRTHVEIDDVLLEQVIRLGGFATKKAAVNAALVELSRALKRRQLMEMRGKVPWSADLAALRSARDAGRADAG